MFNQAKPRKFGAGSLQYAPRNIVFRFKVGKVRHYVLGPFQLKKYTSSSMLLITISGEEYLD